MIRQRRKPARVARSLLESELAVVQTLCENIGSSRALTVWMLIENNEFEQLLDLEWNPNHYLESGLAADDYLVTKILIKHQKLPVSIDRRQRALDKFWVAEEACAQANTRIDSAFNEGVFPSFDVSSAVLNAQRYIERILGPLTRTKLAFAYDQMRFGPGATTSLGGCVTAGKKYSSRQLHCTPQIADFLLFCRPPGWTSKPNLALREYSKIAVVPKTAKVDRTIGIEPDLNIFVQLGIGALLRDRLLRFGLDLNTQEKNRELAREGSLDDSLCTMDLSSASDTVSHSVVKHLLPQRWVALLSYARTHKFLLDNKVHSFQKWSSMGNGYTFELETLIFLSILYGCADVTGCTEFDKIIAYGDDLIFPSCMQDLVARTLDFLGFSVNTEKTFGKGSFRESCGTDWFLGRDIRPPFFKGADHDQVAYTYSCANKLRKWAFRRNGGYFSLDGRVLPSWKALFKRVDPKDRHRIPSDFGDTGFAGNPSEASLHYRRAGGGLCGWVFDYRYLPPRRKLVDSLGCYIASLRSQTDFCQGYEALRGRFTSPLTRRGYTLVWPDWGPWL